MLELGSQLLELNGSGSFFFFFGLLSNKGTFFIFYILIFYKIK